MRRLLLTTLLVITAFCFHGCGEEGPDLSTPEGAVEAFLKAVEEKDREGLQGLVMVPEYADELWPLIAEKGLAVTGGYTLEEGSYGTTVSFESARYTDNDMPYDLGLTLTEQSGRWLISGYMTVLAGTADDEAADDGRDGESVEDPAAAALEELKETYGDAVKALSDKYAGGDFGGDVQYYIHFVDGRFDRILSVATGHGDKRAYNNAAFRAELDELVEGFEVSAAGEVDVFWVMEFPM